MPRARLELRAVRPRAYHVDDPRRGISNHPIPVRRLHMRFDVVMNEHEVDGVMCEGVVSTAEPFCVFPHGSWLPFRDRFYPLTPPPQFPLPEPWLYRGRHEFDFGLLWISVCDAGVPDAMSPSRTLRAVRALGMFLRKPTEDVNEVLIGLRYSPLSGRRLVCETVPDDPENDHERWWLEEIESL